MEGIALRTVRDVDRIALRGVRVQSRLLALGQKTTIEQTFVNLEDRPIEAVYTFPLPEGAAVCHFEVITDDRVLTGQVDDSDQAEKEYDDQISKGHGAFLLEQNQPDIFTINVGNLIPRQAITIRIAYVAELTVHDSTIRLAFPTTVAPRYVTATGMDPAEAIREGEKINPPHLLMVPYGMSLEVLVDLGLPLRHVESSSHHIVTNMEGPDRSSVTLAGGITEMDRDVVLTVTLVEEPAPVAQAGTGPNGDTFVAVTVQPHFDDVAPAAAQPAEVFFVLDCSGSMAGDSITQAATALELCLRTLNEGDNFNICRFGSTFEFMSPEMLTYSQATLGRAVDFVRRMQADLGGTEMSAPLEAILRIPPRNGEQRQILLLTDGQVGNANAVIDLARGNREQNRIFTFGIGNTCSPHLVEGLARAAGGAAEYVSAGERMEEKVLRMFSRLSSPTITAMQIDWGGREVLEPSNDRPAIFEGDTLTVMGRVAGASPNACRIKMTSDRGTTEWNIPVPSPQKEFELIAALWGRRRIQCLEVAYREQEIQGGMELSRAALERARRRERRQLVETSKEFGLLSSATSFIALEHRSLPERNDGHPAFRRVPVQLARGWGGVTMASLGIDHCHGIFQTPPPLLGRIVKTKRSVRRGGLRGSIRRLDEGAGHPTAVPADPLVEILQAQQADGRFNWNQTLDNELRKWGLTLKECSAVAEAWLARLAPGYENAARVALLETVLVLVVLRRTYLQRRELWGRAQNKAVAFVQAKTGVAGVAIDDLLAALDQLERKTATPGGD